MAMPDETNSSEILAQTFARLFQEAGQRNAVEEMKKLTAEDVFKDVEYKES